MTEEEERAYIQGKRSVYSEMLRQASQGLGFEHTLDTALEVHWAVEREEALQVLRDICGEHGDNDWPNDLNLADVLRNHLQRHL